MERKQGAEAIVVPFSPLLLSRELEHLLHTVSHPCWLGLLGWGSWWGDEGNIETFSALKCTVTCWSQIYGDAPEW